MPKAERGEELRKQQRDGRTGSNTRKQKVAHEKQVQDSSCGLLVRGS